MHTQKLYGSSDDLVGLSGDVNDELPGGESPTYVRFSTGTYAKIHYGSRGVWEIEVLDVGDAGTQKLFGLPDVHFNEDHAQHHKDDDAPSYSDVLIIQSAKPITLEAYSRKPLKAPSPGLAKAKAVIALLDARRGFGDWWGDIEVDDQNDTLEALAKLLEDRS